MTPTRNQTEWEPIMKNINPYDLAFAFTRRPEVTDANVATGMCSDDTVLVEGPSPRGEESRPPSKVPEFCLS